MTNKPQVERNWYAIQTYSGYENAVMRNLKQRIESLGMEDKIFNIIVPNKFRVFTIFDFTIIVCPFST